MDYRTYTKRLDYLQALIEKGQLYSPSDLAVKFDCNEKTVRNMINHLRDSGLNIKYSRKRLRYYIDLR